MHPYAKGDMESRAGYHPWVFRWWRGSFPTSEEETTAQLVEGGASGGQMARALWNPDRISGGCHFRFGAKKGPEELRSRLNFSVVQAPASISSASVRPSTPETDLLYFHSDRCSIPLQKQ